MERISGWTLFKVRGVTVRVHVSLLFLLLYVVLVATASFQRVVEASGVEPTSLSLGPLLWALIFSLSLVVSIFLHEFGHVLVAQQQGSKVKAITLMMLGGVSQIEKMDDDPSTEFKVAIAGPLVSFLLAGILFGIRAFSPSPDLNFYCFWVGQTNLVLGIFNLLPAFPTDGGRVLRSFLVQRVGRLRGTRSAVRVSHFFAWAFGILGLLQFNPLLVLIAFFIHGASKSELFLLEGEIAIKGMKAADLAIPVAPIPSTSTLSNAVDQMNATKNLYLPVSGQDDGGSIISSEIIRQVPKDQWETTLVKDVALLAPRNIDVDDSLEDVWKTAMKTPFGAVPVTHDHHSVGIIKMSDLIETIELRRLRQ